MVGDYRKGESMATDPNQDLTCWVLPSTVAQLLCRLIIYGKPIEVRLTEQLFTREAAGIHRVLLGACNGKQLKSTKLGNMTNATLTSHGCPISHDMRHAREHFFTELVLEDEQLGAMEARYNQREHVQAVAAVASNHSFATAKAVYAGVFEINS